MYSEKFSLYTDEDEELFYLVNVILLVLFCIIIFLLYIFPPHTVAGGLALPLAAVGTGHVAERGGERRLRAQVC